MRPARIVVTVIAMLLHPVAIAPAQRVGPAPSGGRAFATEALGGAVGSAVGIAVGLAVARPDDCPSNEDLACMLRRLGVTGMTGLVGAAAGTVVAGRLGGTGPSVVGALVGAAAGTAAGIALEHLFTEELKQPLGSVGAVVLFSVAQGMLAAAGSRLVASLRAN